MLGTIAASSFFPNFVRDEFARKTSPIYRSMENGLGWAGWRPFRTLYTVYIITATDLILMSSVILLIYIPNCVVSCTYV